MGAARAVAVVEDPRYRRHRAPYRHPECPERLAAVAAAVAERGDRVVHLAPHAADDGELLLVHGREHLDRVSEAAARAPAQLDPDTYVCAASLEVARLAAGGAVDLARLVARGEARAGFAALRPPGHHAEARRAMGFCLFNSVAIAARALQRQDGVGRILVLDWDVHHGNGTQQVFEDDPSVLYFSTHQYPYYPGTGAAGEAGVGRGLGTTVNVPLPAGCGDAEYVGVFQRLLAPVARAFRPEFVLVSCGFDAHWDDPLAAMELSGEGFRALAQIARALADELCGGRLALFLEGGYSATGLREGTAAVLDTLLAPAAEPPAPAPLPAGSVLERVVEQVVRVHGGRVPGLGRS